MSKAKHKTPNLPPETLLRVRLDGLWQNPSLPSQSAAHIIADLDKVTAGLKLEPVVRAVLAAYGAAGPEAQAALDLILPQWLEQRHALPVLETAVLHQTLTGEAQAVALRWLAQAGKTIVMPAASETFFQAHIADDGSQASVIVIWYTHAKRNRVSALSFLLDYNPPWEGAVKDIMVYPVKPPEVFLENFVENWARRDLPMLPLTAAEAKQKIFTALNVNHATAIRLPKDLIAERALFFERIAPLPNGPDTPAFTPADFDAASREGQTPEQLAAFEHTVGRRIRLEDGQEVFMDASLANDLLRWDTDEGEAEEDE